MFEPSHQHNRGLLDETGSMNYGRGSREAYERDKLTPSTETSPGEYARGFGGLVTQVLLETKENAVWELLDFDRLAGYRGA